MRYLLVIALLASTARADDGEEVLAPIEHRDPPVLVQPQPGTQQQAWLATVVAGSFVVMTGFSYMWAQHTLARLDDYPLRAEDAAPRADIIIEADRWHSAAYWLAAGSVVSISVAGYLWTRAQPHFEPQVAAGPHGATVGFAGSF